MSQPAGDLENRVEESSSSTPPDKTVTVTQTAAIPVRSTHRFLSPTEWARVAHGLGAVEAGEDHIVIHPKCCLWPPKGLPDGLYRDIIANRTKYNCLYHAFNALRWVLMLLQIVIGAVLTSLGSLAEPPGTPITILAALNTVVAGLIALLHNSGLPYRYQSNNFEFSRVADHVRELLDTGIVEKEQTVDDIISVCFRKAEHAKVTVRANMPSNYVSTSPPMASTRLN